jgi:hypothetical protein
LLSLALVAYRGKAQQRAAATLAPSRVVAA